MFIKNTKIFGLHYDTIKTEVDVFRVYRQTPRAGTSLIQKKLMNAPPLKGYGSNTYETKAI